MSQTTPPPRPLSEAGVGDRVLVRSTIEHREHTRTHYHSLVVNQAGSRVLRVGALWYYRSGKPRLRSTHSYLVEPTEENLKALRAYSEEMRLENEERERNQKAFDAERAQKAIFAAKWLCDQTVETIITLVGVQNLVDIYRYMEEKGLLDGRDEEGLVSSAGP